MEKSGIPVNCWALQLKLSLSMCPYREHFTHLKNVIKLLCVYSVMGIQRNLFFLMLTFPQARAFNSFSSPLWHLFLGQANKAMSSANTSELPTSDRNEKHVPKTWSKDTSQYCQCAACNHMSFDSY